MSNSIMTTAAVVFAASFGILVFNAYAGDPLPNPLVQWLAGGVVFGLVTCFFVGVASSKR